MKITFPAFSLLLAVSLPATLHADEKEAAMELGKTKFMICGACHGPDGKGLEIPPGSGVRMAPAYAESAIVKTPELMALVVMKGIAKTDTKYLGVMAPLEAAMSDKDLAGVLTYVRDTFAGAEGVVSEADVAKWRAKYKGVTQPLTRDQIAERAAAMPAR